MSEEQSTQAVAAPVRNPPADAMTALGGLMQAMNRSADFVDAMRAALETILAVLDFDGGGIYVADDDGQTARVRCWQGLPERFLREVGEVAMDDPRYSPIFRDGEPLFLSHYEQRAPERSREYGLLSIAVIPLHSEDGIFGALNVASARRHHFTESERAALLGVADELGIAFARAQTHDALRRTRADLRAFFDLSPDMLFVLDQDGTVLDANDAAVRQLGYTPEECRGMSVFDLHPAKDRGRVISTVTRMVSGLETSCAIPLVSKSGHEIPVETRIAHGTWDSRDALFGICRNSRSERVLQAAVEAFSAALDLRDASAAGHTLGVVAVAEAIARRLDLPPDQADLVVLAAKVHDVGKLAIPSDILAKPAALSTAELMVVRDHAAVGADLLKPFEFLGPIPMIVRQHHERCDGSGYPDGLSGDDILLEARILAVADTVEAMSAHRPYRPALPLSAAITEIRNGRGILYDRKAADALLALHADGELPLAAAQRKGRRRTADTLATG